MIQFPALAGIRSAGSRQTRHIISGPHVTIRVGLGAFAPFFELLADVAGQDQAVKCQKPLRRSRSGEKLPRPTRMRPAWKSSPT